MDLFAQVKGLSLSLLSTISCHGLERDWKEIKVS